MSDESVLSEHERHSAERAAHIERVIQHMKEKTMDSGVTDKVDVHNIFKGMGEHGGGFGGVGSGFLGGILGGALFGNSRGGLFGGGGDGDSGAAVNNINDTVFNTAVLSKLGSIEAAIPLASAQTENVILQQTNAITNLSTQAQLANAAGFAATKDAVQSGAVINLQATNQGVAQVIAAVNALGSKIDAGTIAQLQAELAEQRVSNRTREVEVNVSQSVNQAQAQAQQQAQLQGLFNAVGNLANDLQLVRQGQTIFNSGTMAASGTQAAANTRVN